MGIWRQRLHRIGLDAARRAGNKGEVDAVALFDAGAAALRANRIEEARSLFGRAGAAGRHDAAVIHCNLTASGGDWAGGFRLLAELARTDLRCRRQFELIRAMDLGATLRGEVLSEAPHLTFFPSLFSVEECRYLIEASTPMLAPAVVVDAATGAQRPDPVRISDSAGFTLPLENPAVHALNQRVAAASGTAWAQGEPLQVLRYGPGGEYKPHCDALPGLANQRVLTMIVWLNEDYAGGETLFMKTSAKLRGRTGDALLFRNALPDGRRDPDSGHAGLPVTQGEKLIASRWIRARPFDLGQEAAADGV
jgi:prolyl 4-hydroxylase